MIVARTFKTRQESGHCMKARQESGHHTRNQAAKINSVGVGHWRGRLIWLASIGLGKRRGQTRPVDEDKRNSMNTLAQRDAS